MKDPFRDLKASNDFIVRSFERANQNNLGLILSKLTSDENLSITEEDALELLEMNFDNFVIPLKEVKENKMIIESGKTYLNGLLNLKGINKKETLGFVTYALNTDEIPGLYKLPVSKLGLSSNELIQYIISANKVN